MKKWKLLLTLGFFVICMGLAGFTFGAGDAIHDIKKPFHVADARKVFGKLKNGHGPYLWSSSPDGKTDIWFWFLPHRGSDASDSHNELEIVFISEGEADNPDTQQVVWPDAFSNMPLKQVYQQVYAGFEK
jgi:hypothetical protein